LDSTSFVTFNIASSEALGFIIIIIMMFLAFICDLNQKLPFFIVIHDDILVNAFLI